MEEMDGEAGGGVRTIIGGDFNARTGKVGRWRRRERKIEEFEG